MRLIWEPEPRTLAWVAGSHDEQSWRCVRASVRLIEVGSGVSRPRCQSHLMKDALDFLPRPSMRDEVTASIRAVFDAPDRIEADRQLDLAVKKYRAVAPKLAEWREQDVPESLTIFMLPAG